ncbi:hypothetical protein A5482_015480 (plasmid) [Cyanobacterium sp. IPPAS B-1200]|uniref:hypothetical protein n=1 Tax=Cyanobacterium sp. IPPAS B-1200 TaxID=1562720 RepID=UPI003D5B2A7B
MPRKIICSVYLNEDEKEKANALSEERGITLSDLFKSVLYRKIPKTPSQVKVKAILKLGEVRNQIEELMECIPLEQQKKFKDFSKVLDRLSALHFVTNKTT